MKERECSVSLRLGSLKEQKRLLKSEEKPAPYIKVDWKKWCDEDEEESDTDLASEDDVVYTAENQERSDEEGGPAVFDGRELSHLRQSNHAQNFILHRRGLRSYLMATDLPHIFVQISQIHNRKSLKKKSLKESSRNLSIFKFKFGVVVALVLFMAFGLLNSLFEELQSIFVHSPFLMKSSSTKFHSLRPSVR